jgi:hypothetical protein
MEDLLSEMKRCRTVEKCIDVATTDAYGDDEQATSWLTCIEEMFGKFDRVKILGEEVKLEKFDLDHNAIIEVCKKGTRKVKVTLDSIEFPKLTANESLWLKACKEYSDGFN